MTVVNAASREAKSGIQPSLSPIDFKFFADFLKKKSGIVIEADKLYLVENRLLPLARKHGLAGLKAVVGAIRQSQSSTIAREAVDAMTTNETFFFRDKTPFDNFNNHVLPALLESRRATKNLRIWCAASSTGQEPYSLAMCLKEAGPKLAGWRIDITASDLSDEALVKARNGRYSQFEVQRGLPVQYLLKYFRQDGDNWCVSDELKAMVRYQKFNLLDSFAGFGTCDVIFCRNVLIYFDPMTKRDILNRLSRSLAGDGFMAMGAAETVVGLCDEFKPVPGTRGLYGKASALAADSGSMSGRSIPKLSA